MEEVTGEMCLSNRNILEWDKHGIV